LTKIIFIQFSHIVFVVYNSIFDNTYKMFEMTEYLQNLYKALKEKDIERIEEIGVFIENDDQYDYETHDVREINLLVDDYVKNKNDISREKALILIDEFDMWEKRDEYATTDY